MGTAHEPSPVKLIVGLLADSDARLQSAGQALQELFGAIDLFSRAASWTVTTYYRDELGDEIARQFVSFQRLVRAASLPDIKETTNHVEDSMREQGRRRVNIDPGYVGLSKLVLASTKDAGHRIYLDRGIYAEATLLFVSGSFVPAAHTYADYAERDAISFFNRVRATYRRQLREL